MNENKREVRSMECQLHIREAAPDAQGNSRTIAGTAIVFNAESQVLNDGGERFCEVIMPEAATAEFLNSQDIKLNMLHDRSMTLARCNKGVGSLRLSVDEKGVNFEFEAPACDLGDRCLEMVRRGDYSGCSFEFYPDEYDVEERKGGKDILVKHKKFARITALTIGMDPAYTQTNVSVRELTATTGEDEETAREEGSAETDSEDEARERVNRLRERELEQIEMEMNIYNY